MGKNAPNAPIRPVRGETILFFIAAIGVFALNIMLRGYDTPPLIDWPNHMARHVLQCGAVGGQARRALPCLCPRDRAEPDLRPDPHLARRLRGSRGDAKGPHPSGVLWPVCGDSRASSRDLGRVVGVAPVVLAAIRVDFTPHALWVFTGAMLILLAGKMLWLTDKWALHDRQVAELRAAAAVL